MEISVEISYFPLSESYMPIVFDFINALEKNAKVKLEPGTMSSLLTGSYDDIMSVIQEVMKPFMERYPSVFVLKFSNSCVVCDSIR